MYLSRHKRESLVGTNKEFLPIVNHKYKQKIAEIRKSIECAVTKYEEDQIKLQGFKEMKKYLEENAMSHATNKAVIKDMIARNECQLNDAARVYYFETKIKNQRSVKHKDINDINKVGDRLNPKSTIDKALGKDEDVVVQNSGRELKEKSKARKDLHCPKRPATFVARHYTSSSKRQVGNNKYEDKRAKALVKRMDYGMHKHKHRHVGRKRHRRAVTPKTRRNSMVKASLLSVSRDVSSPTARKTHFKRNFTQIGTNALSQISGKLSGFLEINQLCNILERASSPYYNPSDTRVQKYATASPRHVYTPRRPSTAPNRGVNISLQSPRSRKTPIRGGLGVRRNKISEKVRIKAETPKDVAIETALNTVLNGKVKMELGSSVDKRECFQLHFEVTQKGNGAPRSFIKECKNILINQYHSKVKAALVIQKFLRRWNWKKCWNQTVRSHLSVSNAAAKIIQKNWRYKHLLFSVRFWNNQRRRACRRLQRWWRHCAELIKEDLEEAAIKKDKALINKYFKNVTKTGATFRRKNFVNMCTKIWRQQYEPTCLTEEEVDDMMLEITGGVDGDIEVDDIIRWRIDCRYGGREY